MKTIPPPPVTFITILVFCILCILWDLRIRKIPNSLNLVGLCAGIAASTVTGRTGGLAGSLAGASLGFFILAAPFVLRMVGGGDVKFLAAAGSIVGWNLLWQSFLVGAVIGGLLGLAVMVARRRSFSRLKYRLMTVLNWNFQAACRDEVNRLQIPYAVPLSAGLLICTAVRVFGYRI